MALAVIGMVRTTVVGLTLFGGCGQVWGQDTAGRPQVEGATKKSLPAKPAEKDKAQKTAAPTGDLKAAEAFDFVWSTIKRTHYDEALAGIDWNKARDELRPKALAARNQSELRQILQQLLGRLGESHFNILSRDSVDKLQPKDNVAVSKVGEAGLAVRFLDSKVVVGSVPRTGPAANAGVKPGWQLVKINQDLIADLIKALPVNATPEERAHYITGACQRRLSGETGSTVVATFIDEQGSERTITMERARSTGEASKFGNLPTIFTKFEKGISNTPQGRRVGWIRFNIWLPPIAAAFDQAIDEMRDCDGIVIDIRGNPGGLGGLVCGTGGHFVEQSKSLGTMSTRGSNLRLEANPRTVRHGKKVKPFAGPVAVLIDGGSASTSEIFAGGLQAIGRARIFGEKSAGMALPSALVRMPNGDVLQHVVANLTLPNGNRLEGKGVYPDEVVPTTQKDLLEGRDPPMQAALDWIDKERSNKH